MAIAAPELKTSPEPSPDPFSADILTLAQNLPDPLGGFVIEAVEIAQDPEGAPRLRSHYDTHSVDGYRMGIYTTEPHPRTPSEEVFDIYVFPGYLELIEGEIFRQFQHGIARANPSARVLGVANDGTGRTGGRVGISSALQHGLNGMAQNHGELITDLSGNKEVILAATSINTIVTNKMLRASYADSVSRLPVDGVVYFSPALIVDGRFLKLLKFVPSTAADTGREILNTPLKHMPELVKSLFRSAGFRPADAIPLVVEALDVLFRSTRLDEVEEVVATEPKMSVIYGDADPIAESFMWKSLKAAHPHLQTQAIPRRAHGLAANGYRGGHKVGRTVKKLRAA